jgi:gliding motility-associated-like protein
MIGVPTNNAVSYAWNNANGLSAINVSNPTLNLTNLSNSTPLNVSYILTGTETLNGIGCDNSDTMMVVINPLPNIGAGPDISICQFDPITLNGTGGVSYTWNNGVVNNTPFNQNSNSVTYTVIGNNVFNCFNSDSMTVTMNLLPNVTAGSDTIICTGDQLVLSGSGAQNYTWNNGQTNNNPFIPPSGITNYVVTGTDGFGCFNLDTLVATVYNVPIPTFTYTIDCYSHTITFANITQGSSNLNPAAILSSNWDFGDNSVNSNLTNPQHLYSSNGNYSVTLTTSSSEGGCNDSVTQVVNIPIIPSVTSTVVLGCDRRADFTGSVIPTNTPLNYINWDYGDGNSLTSTNLNTTYNYSNSGVFNTSFNFTDVNNCTYSFFLPIEIFNNELLEDQEIPNVITANGDNVNDEFLLDGVIDICLEYEIVILNRWGNKVFQTNQFGQVFKGDDLNGETLSEGVYFYIIRADSQERVGHITIIK